MTSSQNQAGRRGYDPKRAGDLHSALAGIVAHFLRQHPDTLKAEVLAAIETTRQAYSSEAYHQWKEQPTCEFCGGRIMTDPQRVWCEDCGREFEG